MTYPHPEEVFRWKNATGLRENAEMFANDTSKLYCVQHKETGLFLIEDKGHDQYIVDRNYASGYKTEEEAKSAARKFGLSSKHYRISRPGEV